MLPTYKAILRGDRLEWSGDAPSDLAVDRALSVYVTVLEEGAGILEERGQRMAAALDRLAALRGVGTMEDPLAWEREARKDRCMPERDI